MRRTRTGPLCILAATGLAAALLSPTPAGAQPPPDQEQQIAIARQELQQVGAKLQSIQEAAMKKSRRLRTQQDRLRSMLEVEMRKQGHDPTEGIKQMEALKKKLQGGKLSNAEQRATISKLQAKVQAMQMAQLKAMQQDKIRKASKAFQTKLETAMIKHDPAAKKLLKRYKDLADRLRLLMGKARG